MATPHGRGHDAPQSPYKLRPLTECASFISGKCSDSGGGKGGWGLATTEVHQKGRWQAEVGKRA